MRNLSGIFILIMAVSLTTSCRHKQLCYDHSHVVFMDVVFDWSASEEACPKSMSVYLFPKDSNDDPLRYEFTNMSGGEIRVPTGVYEVMCMNSDTENIRYRNTKKKNTFEVYTRQTGILSYMSIKGIIEPKNKGLWDDEVVLPTDILWTDRIDEIEIRPYERSRIVLKPVLSTTIVTVEAREIDNLQFVTSISASLSGLAYSFYPGLGSDVVGEEVVTVPFEAKADKAASIVTGVVTAFGHCPTETNSHHLTIYAVLSDESKWYYTYDVTEQMHAAEDQRHIHLVVSGLPLPDPIEDGGFRPTVDEWQVTVIGIEM